MERTNSIVGDALSRVESFIRSFEGGELQEGPGELLDAIRLAREVNSETTDALKSLIGYTEHVLGDNDYYKSHGCLKDARAAIAKAEGRANG